MEEKIAGVYKYADLPNDFKRYLRYYGLHFNPYSYEFAASTMKRKVAGGKASEKMKPIDKELFKQKMKAQNIEIEEEQLYDGMFVWTMLMSDDPEITEVQAAKGVKRYLNDIDQADGYIFSRWLSDMMLKGRYIIWEELI